MKVLSIAATSLKQIFRDRTTIFFTILFPFLIIFVIGTATAGFDRSSAPVGIVEARSGTLARQLAGAVRRSRLVSPVRFGDVLELRRSVRRGAVAAGVVIPDDYDARLRSGRPVDIRFLADPTRGFPAGVRAAVSAAVADQGTAVQAARFVTERVGGSFDSNLGAARRTEKVFRPVDVESRTLGGRARPSLMAGFEYTAPANLVLFVFIIGLAASAQIIESRRLGVTRRMLSTPTHVRTVMAGQALGRFAIAAFQGVYILVLGRFVFGVDFGDPLAATVLVLLFVLVATSFGVLFGTVFRTPEQAGSIGPPVGIAMGMLAGCMWPRFVMPGFMQRIGQLFPQAWAMDAWIALIARGAGLRAILPELAVLAAFVVALLPLAAWRLRRSIVTS